MSYNDPNGLFQIFLPISFGWAAGDVSLAAYIQACLARRENENDNVSALGAVMAFLYSTYIVTYAILQPTLGAYVDKKLKTDGPHYALKYVGGVQFTVIGIILFCSTFIPRGAFAFNPQLLFGEDLTGPVDGDQSGKLPDFDIVDPEKSAELPSTKHHTRPSFDEREDVPMGMAEAAHNT